MQQLDPKAVWLFSFQAVLSWVAPVIAFAVVVPLMPATEMSGIFGQILGSGIVLVIVLALISYGWAALTRHFYRYELREDGFRKEHGIIWKRYVTIPYDRIQNVDIHRGIIARLLGLSDLQIQTAGAITAGSYGAFSEGRLPGISRATAEEIRDELVRRARGSRSQGL